MLLGRLLGLSALALLGATAAAQELDGPAPSGSGKLGAPSHGQAGDSSWTVRLGFYDRDDSGGAGGNPFLDESLTIIEPAVIYDHQVSEDFGYSARFTYDFVSSASIERLGNFAAQSGASRDNYLDLDLGFRHRLSDTDDLSWHVNVATEYDYTSFGAGDGTKTFLLLDALRRAGVTTRYVPVDISEGAMASLHAKVEAKLPDQAVHGLVGDYVGALRHLSTVDDRHRLVLFLGSNIGNFDKPRARAFLRRLWTGLRPGDHALIGFDLKKDIEVLLAAYNDRNGTTSAFNLNLLARINRELGGHFDLSEWRHYGTYNVFTGAMESYIVSLKEQHVAIDALRTSFHFMPWEPIHTEYSYKYLDHDITDLAAFTGFEIVSRFCDDKKWFCDALWRVR